jgi:hypothetical protein
MTFHTRLSFSVLQYWHPCEVKENLVELDPYNTYVDSASAAPFCLNRHPRLLAQISLSAQFCSCVQLHHLLCLLRFVLRGISTRNVFNRVLGRKSRREVSARGWHCLFDF